MDTCIHGQGFDSSWREVVVISRIKNISTKVILSSIAVIVFRAFIFCSLVLLLSTKAHSAP